MTGTKKSCALWSLITALALVAGCVVPASAQAPGPMPRRGAWMDGWGDGLTLPALLRTVNLTPDQDSKVRAILSARRAPVRSIIEQLRQAQQDLADRMLAPGQVQTADLQPQLQRISQLREQLLQGSAQTTLDIRAILTPDQIAKAAQVKDRTRELRSEMRQLLQPSQP